MVKIKSENSNFKEATVRINIYKHRRRQTIQVHSLARLLHYIYNLTVLMLTKLTAAVRLQLNEILHLFLNLNSFSIYCHTSMKSFHKLICWLLMKLLLFHCQWWNLCLAPIWFFFLLLLMGMPGVCFWWNLPYIMPTQFLYEELSILVNR